MWFHCGALTCSAFCVGVACVDLFGMCLWCARWHVCVGACGVRSHGIFGPDATLDHGVQAVGYAEGYWLVRLANAYCTPDPPCRACPQPSRMFIPLLCTGA